MNADELKAILASHKAWLDSEPGGRRAVLSGAVLSGADLRRADLSGAVLSGAVLSGADLRRAVLSGADLRRAVLSGADLRRADLSGAVLSGADLSGAVLSGADLSGAVLSDIKEDFINAILKLPNEIPFLRQALIEGRIDGSTYEGECACLAGTMAHACKADNFWAWEKTGMFPVNADSPRERWFLAIERGHTPENSPVAKITLEWIDEAIGRIPQAQPADGGLHGNPGPC